MIECEKYLLAVIRSSINAVFRETPSTFCTARSLGRLTEVRAEPTETNKEPFSVASLKRSFSAKTSREDEPIQVGRRETQPKLDSFLSATAIKKQASSDEVAMDSAEVCVLDSGGGGSFQVDRQHARRPPSSKPARVIVEDDSKKPCNRKRRRVTFSMEQIGRENAAAVEDEGEKFRRFLSNIAPDENANAELELKKHFSKADFLSMRVVGQFNKGFIIARLKRDLFIVDQHASDEKYNFERLEAIDVLTGQDMVIPQKLELTAAAECVLRDNVHVFAKNGFEFDLRRPRDVRLTRIPHHRNW